MTIGQIYQLAIKMGMAADLRGAKRVNKILQRTKEKYEKLNSDQKKEFDLEKFTNPYSDARVLYGDSEKQVKKVLVGIDVGPDEVLLADRLGGIDLIISHHPLGKALADLHDVMHLQAQVLADHGVPINIAESLMKERIEEVARGVSPINHQRAVDTARLLKIPMICIHTPADNLAASFLDKKIKREKPETVGELLKLLKNIEEYQEAIKNNAGPKIWVGSEDSSVGKVVLVEITGGTEGAKGMYEKMAQAGIGTVVGMHMDEERKKSAQEAHINVIIAGHISSDSLGMNQLLDELEKKSIEIVPCSGLIRVSRIKKTKKSKPKAKKVSKTKKKK